MSKEEFEAVYRCYFSAVYRYLLKSCGDPALSEEMTSETFFMAMRFIDGFRRECDIKSWLIQIAKNCLASYFRRHGGPQSCEPLQDEAAPEQALFPDESGALEALRGLKEPYREIVSLRAIGGLGFREIGALFQKDANWACVAYHRARKKMRAELEEEDE